MKPYLITLITILLLCGCSKISSAETPVLNWEKPRTVCAGGYGRIHPLSDGSLMLTYSSSGSSYCRVSTDEGLTWSTPVLIMEAFNYEGVLVRCSNPEFVQLSSGRIIFTSNLRPADKKSSVHPFSIAISISDDGGKTWSERQTVYAPPLWDEDVSKGAWEPFPMELPDGRVQVYFTDNTPHYLAGDTRGNNISVIESSDGGNTWSKETIVCHTPGGWDGMPVVAGTPEKRYLAVEHKDKRGSEYAMEIKIRTTGPDFSWKGESFIVGHKGYYCGAPYIIKTEDYYILSCQSAKGSDTPLADTHSIPAVWYGRTPEEFAPASKPVDIDQTQSSGLWNSLCPLGGNRFYLVTQCKGKIMITKGSIE